MSAYLDKVKAERVQRLARMRVAQDSVAAARAPFSATDPEWVRSLWWDELNSIKSRLGTIEARLDLLAECSGVLAPQAPIRIADIKGAVCRAYGVTAAELEGPSRHARINRARQVAMYLARQLTGKSFIAIACQFGPRGHAGAFKAWRKIDRGRITDPDLDDELRALIIQLRAGAVSQGPDASSPAGDAAS
jgi:hypothetical protein